MPKKILFSLFVLFQLFGKAQSLPSDSALSRLFQSDKLLPLLIDSAIKNSADIKRVGQSVALHEQNLQAVKKSLLNNVVLNSSYGYGNIGNISMEKDGTTINPLATMSTLRTNRYNVGVSILMPLGAILTRKNASRTVELQIDMAESEKQSTALFIKQEVIKMYQELKLSHALLTTRGKMKQSASVSINIAQKSFVDGQLTVEQYSKLQNDYNQTVLDYETQVNRFQTSFLVLEAYTGVQLTNLISRIR